jgi:hypothetical protein
MTASLDVQAHADYIKTVLEASLTGVNVYAKPPGDAAIEYPAIGIVPRAGDEGLFVEYQCTFGARGLTKTHWNLELVCANPETEDQYTETFDMLGIGTRVPIFDALAAFNDNTSGYTGVILGASPPLPSTTSDGIGVITSRIPITVHQQRTA